MVKWFDITQQLNIAKHVFLYTGTKNILVY